MMKKNKNRAKYEPRVERALQRRGEWNRSKNVAIAQNNAEMTDSQHRAMAILSEYRHWMHCNSKAFFDERELFTKYSNFLIYALPTMLRVNGLPGLDLTEELRQMPTKTLTDSLGLDDEYVGLARETCISVEERINKRIETYMRHIDEVYGTWYAPTGCNRGYVMTA